MKKDWWKKIFNQDYIKTYIDITSEELTNKQVSFFIDKFKPIDKKRILDLGCGYGRHTLKLAKFGCSITGLDYSKSLLNIAKSNAKKEGIKANFILGDMRNFTFKNKFDVVISMFTSIGYFYDFVDHEATFRHIAKSIKPKGLFLLDLNNPARQLISIIKNGQLDRKEGILVVKKKSQLSNGLKIIIIQEFNLITMRWKLIRKWREGNKYKKYASDIYLFTLPEVQYLLEKSGLQIRNIWGDFDGSPFNFKSRRLIVLARKK